MLPNDKTLTTAISRLQKLGFDKDFKLDKGEMICLQTKKRYQTEDMLIVSSQRFKGLSNPTDMTALYVIQCKDGTRGLILTAYSSHGNISLIEFLDKVKIQDKQKRSDLIEA